MPNASLSVEVSRRRRPARPPVDGRPVAFGPWGVDEVELLLVAHAGAPARPLHRGASGGELSRVMLAVEIVLAGADGVPMLHFRRGRCGVGGRAAIEVGRRLAGLARTAQVLVVTHLPQVAAFADRHVVVVAKSATGLVTSTEVDLVDGAGRCASSPGCWAASRTRRSPTTTPRSCSRPRPRPRPAGDRQRTRADAAGHPAMLWQTAG